MILFEFEFFEIIGGGGGGAEAPLAPLAPRSLDFWAQNVSNLSQNPSFECLSSTFTLWANYFRRWPLFGSKYTFFNSTCIVSRNEFEPRIMLWGAAVYTKEVASLCKMHEISLAQCSLFLAMIDNSDEVEAQYNIFLKVPARIIFTTHNGEVQYSGLNWKLPWGTFFTWVDFVRLFQQFGGEPTQEQFPGHEFQHPTPPLFPTDLLPSDYRFSPGPKLKLWIDCDVGIHAYECWRSGFLTHAFRCICLKFIHRKVSLPTLNSSTPEVRLLLMYSNCAISLFPTATDVVPHL